MGGTEKRDQAGETHDAAELLDLRKGEKELGCYVASMELEEEKLHDASWDLPLWRKGRVESLLLVAWLLWCGESERGCVFCLFAPCAPVTARV
jgi:hypothetical protein